MSDVNGSYITTKSQHDKEFLGYTNWLSIIYIYIHTHTHTHTHNTQWQALITAGWLECVGLYVGTDRVSIYGYMRLSQLRILVQSITQQEVKIIKIVRIKTKDNTDNVGTY